MADAPYKEIHTVQCADTNIIKADTNIIKDREGAEQRYDRNKSCHREKMSKQAAGIRLKGISHLGF